MRRFLLCAALAAMPLLAARGYSGHRFQSTRPARPRAVLDAGPAARQLPEHGSDLPDARDQPRRSQDPSRLSVARRARGPVEGFVRGRGQALHHRGLSRPQPCRGPARDPQRQDRVRALRARPHRHEQVDLVLGREVAHLDAGRRRDQGRLHQRRERSGHGLPAGAQGHFVRRRDDSPGAADVLRRRAGTRTTRIRKSDVARIGAVAAQGGSLGLVKYMGALPRVVPPGSKFNYNTGETHLVGAIVRAAVGNNLSSYASQKIWSKFAMESNGFWMLADDVRRRARWLLHERDAARLWPHRPARAAQGRARPTARRSCRRTG